MLAVTTTFNNLILGRVYCHHHGTMNISGNRRYSCKLTFKEQSFLDRSPRQVQGVVKDADGSKVATLMGKWDESMHCIIGDDASKVNSHGSNQSVGDTLLWQKNEPPANPTRYNLSAFAIKLNELTPELKEKLPPTDSRLRPDQRRPILKNCVVDLVGTPPRRGSGASSSLLRVPPRRDHRRWPPQHHSLPASSSSLCARPSPRISPPVVSSPWRIWCGHRHPGPLRAHQEGEVVATGVQEGAVFAPHLRRAREDSAVARAHNGTVHAGGSVFPLHLGE
ncbi:hypothetical protein U9M48_007977 [Paspalum notatum var. saurae]|uniref:Uncharacterized protein n=1 Tax=Paspalum notatum var. saurae TaxID=547442 RepID=A0AAQ3SN92_PASNO